MATPTTCFPLTMCRKFIFVAAQVAAARPTLTYLASAQTSAQLCEWFDEDSAGGSSLYLCVCLLNPYDDVIHTLL